jgi:hypothetical protein
MFTFIICCSLLNNFTIKYLFIRIHFVQLLDACVIISATRFLEQYFSVETQGTSHPALNILNRLCTATNNLLVEVG